MMQNYNGASEQEVRQVVKDRDEQELAFQYKNWRGEFAIRRVIPKKIWFGESEWHEGNQWFLQAFDIEKSEIRDFALLDMIFEVP